MSTDRWSRFLYLQILILYLHKKLFIKKFNFTNYLLCKSLLYKNLYKTCKKIDLFVYKPIFLQALYKLLYNKFLTSCVVLIRQLKVT